MPINRRPLPRAVNLWPSSAAPPITRIRTPTATTFTSVLNGGIVVNPGSTVTNTAGVAPAAGVTGHSLTLGDRPELRLDPTQLLTTGAITNVSGADVIGGELAGQFDHFFAQGEYYEYLINRYANAAAPQAADLNFNGGYVQASWSIGG